MNVEQLTRKGFKKGFTLVEMMIVVAIIAILAGVAIPQYLKYVRKSEAVEAIGFLKQIVDAQSIYRSSHGKFYAGTDMNQTIKVLSIDAPGGSFSYSIQLGGTNENTVLLRAYKRVGTDGTTAITTPTAPFIYMFYPRENYGSVNPAYNQDEWENTVFNSDFINNDTSHTVDIGGTWKD